MQAKKWTASLMMTACLYAPCQAQAYRGDVQMIPLCAPYALYPDTVLAQVLLASAYPEQLLEAHAWCNNHANLHGPKLASALSYQGWDNSVKALCPYPQVMYKMISDMPSTTSLGADFRVDKTSVLDCIQGLRAQAHTRGALSNNAQQKIVVSDATIQIQPTDPDTVFLPNYDPTVFTSNANYGDGLLTFGTGVALGAPFKNSYAAINWVGHVVYTGPSVYASCHGGSPLGNPSQTIRK